MTIIFSPIPPSKKNSKQIICTQDRPRLISSKAYRAWHDGEMWILKKYKPKKPIEKCEISCEFWFPDNRRRDLSNVFEGIADILVDAEILKDDDWKTVESILLYAMGIDKKHPRVEVRIEEL